MFAHIRQGCDLLPWHWSSYDCTGICETVLNMDMGYRDGYASNSQQDTTKSKMYANIYFFRSTQSRLKGHDWVDPKNHLNNWVFFYKV